jgi:phenylpyruvate tautomerase PptA (4-oxalocrotonate tautomerase family)
VTRPTKLTELPQRLRRRIPQRLQSTGGDGGDLAARVSALEAAVDENRRLNQRLADVIDVVTEVLVPALDRDDERVRKALDDLDQTLKQVPARP